jgi:hypothetical protein
MGYWIGAWVMGPRYYYEALFSLTILTAAGIAWLAGLPLKPDSAWRRPQGYRRFRHIAVLVGVGALIALNLIFYTPDRIGGMRGLYGTSRQQLEPFRVSGDGVSTPALVVVDSENWRAYAGLLELSHPMLDSPYIFIWSRGPRSNAAIAEAFPERSVYFYFPEVEPWVFYTPPE